MARNTGRSGCPINLSVEVLGDSWSVIVLRDVIFGDRRHFRELYERSEEGIATNILAARLTHLVDAGLLTKHPDPTHKQRSIYSLTEAGIQLVPVLAMLGDWGTRWLPATATLSARARFLADGGPELWERFMTELRADHLGTSQGGNPGGGSARVREQLGRVYADAVAAETA